MGAGRARSARISAGGGVLGGRHPEPQSGTEPIQERRLANVMRNADRGALQVHLALHQGQLDTQQLVEHEAATGLSHLV